MAVNTAELPHELSSPHSVESYELARPPLWSGGLRAAAPFGAAIALAVMVFSPWGWQLEQLRVALILGASGALGVALSRFAAVAGRVRRIELHADHIQLPAEWPWSGRVRAAYARLGAIAGSADRLVVDLAGRGFVYPGTLALDELRSAVACRLAEQEAGAELLERFQRRSRAAQLACERGAPATHGLMALLLACYFAQTVYAAATEPATLARMGAGSSLLIAQGQWYRLITACLLHFGPGHLLGNVLALWIAGRKLEPVIGSARLLIIFFVSGFTSSLVTLPLPTVHFFLGASGGVFGLIASRGVQELYFGHELPESVRSTQRIWLGNAWYIDIFFGLAAALWTPRLNWVGHLGGMLEGATCAYVMLRGWSLPEIMTARPPALRRAAVAICSAVAASLLVAGVHAANDGDRNLLLVLARIRSSSVEEERLQAAIALAKCESASPADLTWARATLGQALERASVAPPDGARWAIGLANYRLGDFTAAIDRQLDALDRDHERPVQGNAMLASSLAAYRAQQLAVLQRGRASDQAVLLEAIDPRQLDASVESTVPVELFAVARRRGEISGVLRIWIAPSDAVHHRIVAADSGPASWPPDAQFELALVRAQANRPTDQDAWRYFPIASPPSAANFLHLHAASFSP